MSNLTKMTKAQLIETVEKLAEELRQARKKVKREESTIPSESKYVALSYLGDPKTRGHYLYEIAFDPTTAEIISKRSFPRAPHMVTFEARKMLVEKILTQKLGDDNE